MTAFTMKSPTSGGDLPSGVTAVGGIVLDLIGLNGVRVVVQLAANQLFSGLFDSGSQIGTIGVMGGLSPQVLAQLGGGLAQMAVRMTVEDADTSVGDWDYNQNFLTLNGVELGNLSTQATQATSEGGVPSGLATGFQNGALSTGWFHVTDAGVLAQLFNSLMSSNQASFGLRDLTPGDNSYDFTRGINGSYFGVETPNAAPDAVDDSGYVVSFNGRLTVGAAAGVLANDTDPENANLTATLVSGPQHGTVTLNSDGSFTYIANPGYTGPDSFTYRAGDGALGDEATVSLTVSPNGAPIAGADGYALERGSVLTVDAAHGVLINDSDPEGGALTASLFNQPRHGTVTMNADGSFVYTPNPLFHGTDSFIYLVTDSAGAITAQTVTLTVANNNVAPVAGDDAYAVDRNGVLTVDAAQGVLGNDGDADGDALQVLAAGPPQHGTLTLNADGSFTYTPDSGFSGADTFTYALRDGSTSVPVTVTLTVNPRPGRVVTLDDGANRVTYARDAEAVIVHALAGADSVTGSRFDDELLLGDGADEGIGGDGNDIIRGGAGNDKLFGQGGADRLEGGEGDDLMHGGDGADVMTGGTGNDTYYVHSAEDQVIEQAGEGRDNVRSTVSWVLGDHFEDLLLEGTDDIDGTGNALDNSVLGNNADNVLYGLDGNDTLGGYGGNDILHGGRGDDRLVGREGVNQLFGGEGDDQYFVGSRDTITEADGEGYDVVFSVGDFVLSEHLEALRLDGIGDLRGEGNSGDNYIAGNSGDNALVGHGGNDRIFGGQGDDHLVGDGDGARGDDRLDGGEGSDWLEGGLGDDTLWGGSGSDTFHFDREHLSGDGEGWDAIFDFQGAGTSGSGDQDVLEFSGFSRSATLVFDHYGASASHQFYRVVDPENPGASRLILVQMVGTTGHLTSDDYIFHAA